MSSRGPQHPLQTLIVLHSGAAAGPPSHVFPWLSPLARRGAVATVVPAAGSAAQLYRTIGRTIVVGFAPLTYPGGVRALVLHVARFVADVRAFGRVIRQVRPDLVITVTASVPAALVAAALHGIPTVVFVAEILDKGMVKSRGRSLGAAATARLTTALGDGIVCCSEAVARQFAPGRPRLLRTIYPGVDGTHADGDGARFRMLHGLTDAQPCLAVIGNVTPARGQDVAIRALPRLRQEFPGIRCVFAGVPQPRTGDVSYRHELTRLAGRLGVEDVVTFVGLVDPIADLYAAADIVVNPVRFNEAFGRVAVEALSAGRPVVAARIGAIPEIVREGREALLFEVNDHEALGAAVSRLWRDPRLRAELVRNGRTRVATKFSEDFAVAAFADVVAGVLATRETMAVGTSPAPSR